MHLRHTTRLIRLLAAVACAVSAARPIAAQPEVTATSGSPAAIARIRAEFAAIEREAPGYRRTTHDLWDFSLEGGVLHGFYRGSELRKLTARHFGETWRGSEEYYFAGGRLIFVLVVQERYDEPLSGNVRWRTEHRFYFDEDRLVRHVRTQRPDDADLSLFDPEPARVTRQAELFAACAAAEGAEPPSCTAPAGWLNP